MSVWVFGVLFGAVIGAASAAVFLTPPTQETKQEPVQPLEEQIRRMESDESAE